MLKNNCGTTIIILYLTPTILLGQSIKGIVINETTRRPIEFVNVVLQDKTDSILVTGTVTDKNGKFELINVPEGEYIVKCRLLSYKEKRTAPFKITAQQNILNLGSIALVETTVNLDEVLITSQKSLFNNSIDRKVYNVEQDVMSKAGSASELLKNIPSVEVDIEGNVSLRGSSNVLIMINGRTSPLMGKSRATVLEQMPAASIEKIEVITNPSAKYKPDGTSGIINIVLKKNTNLGLNGSVTTNAGNDDRYNANIQLNYSPGNFNIFGSYSIRKDSRNRINTDRRTEIDSASRTSAYNEDLSSYARPLSHMVALGGDFKFDESNTAGILGNYFYNSFDRTDYANKVLQDSITHTYDRNRFDPEYEKELGLTLFFKHTFEKEDHALQLEYKTSEAPEVEDNHYTNVFWLPPASIQYDNALIKQTERKKEFTLDYSNPISKQSTLEAGYAGESNNYDFDFLIENYDTTQHIFIKDVFKTNRFILDETIHALYATFEHSFGSFGFLAGIRAEQVFTKSNLLTNNIIIDNDYFSLYPTLHLSYDLSDVSELQFNYSKRTRRPEADEMNPFPEYRDAKNISAGNPHLLPEYIHSLEFGCKFQNDQITILPSLYYRYTYNRFTAVKQVFGDSSYTIRQNLSNDQAIGVELITSVSVNELLTSHASVNVFYNQIDASNIGYSSNKSTVTWSGALTFNIQITQTTMFQVNSNYNSARLTPQGENAPSYVVNLGLRQELMEGRLSLTTTIADIFKTLKRETEVDMPSLKETIINKRDSRIFYIGLTYNFGTPPKKSKKEESLRYDNGL